MGFALGSLGNKKKKASDGKKIVSSMDNSTPKSSKTEDKIDAVKSTTVPVGPYTISFYKKEIRRYFRDNTWYFSIDDVAKIADINPDLPFIRQGDPEKLTQAIKEISVKIDGIDAAKPDDIAGIIPLFKGNMPGPIVDWLRESIHQPAPKIENLSRPTTPSTQNQTVPLGVKD